MKLAAIDWKRNRASVFAVGIGRPNEKKLKKWMMDGDEKRIFKTKNYGALGDIAESLAKAVCNGTFLGTEAVTKLGA